MARWPAPLVWMRASLARVIGPLRVTRLLEEWRMAPICEPSGSLQPLPASRMGAEKVPLAAPEKNSWPPVRTSMVEALPRVPPVDTSKRALSTTTVPAAVRALVPV